jgi:chemotaxis protein CheD
MPCEYNDPRFDSRVVTIVLGEYYITGRDVIISTVLGSCVAACIRDSRQARGGMNHFMFAGAFDESQAPANPGVSAELLGTFAMDRLIRPLLERGCGPADLEAKIFGGATAGRLETPDVGRENATFVKAYLQAARIRVAVEDLGGSRSRVIYFSVRTGRIRLRYFGATGETSGDEPEL